ncbi:P-aminobenzoate N-oxygenase AurF [Micromonospora matsumotoense]|uniref:p-aminobenzoate N-oxygenase AurF n=1 Tax=Micromonospora matsumotoense TaxID=121616 RepID=A0A1C5A3D8_9ACTN|nr:diiron oxygenase [Micromonospora matsumotoense]SCF39732.1 P-aminobenzoate N-oxygenase AurF [Micromonospora matsumotoense]
MTTNATIWDDEVAIAVTRLTAAAESEYYNPYQTFEWPESIPEGALWMSEDLVTVHGTAAAAELDREQYLALSKWESINFYSLNVHGIRELMQEVVQRIHTPGFEIPTPFFHHFLGEENEHMWFFAEFCLRYGGKLFANRAMTFPKEQHSALLDNFIVFSRILIFEQIVDHFNSRMAADAALPETIRAINRVHHQDESRHIAFGAQLVRALWLRLRTDGDDKEIAVARQYVEKYIASSLQQLYSVDAYRNAGIPDPFAFRSRVLADPSRSAAHDAVTARTDAFYRRIGLFDQAAA